MVGIRSFPFGARPIFRGYFSFKECNWIFLSVPIDFTKSIVGSPGSLHVVWPFASWYRPVSHLVQEVKPDLKFEVICSRWENMEFLFFNLPFSRLNLFKHVYLHLQYIKHMVDISEIRHFWRLVGTNLTFFRVHVCLIVLSLPIHSQLISASHFRKILWNKHGRNLMVGRSQGLVDWSLNSLKITNRFAFFDPPLMSQGQSKKKGSSLVNYHPSVFVIIHQCWSPYIFLRRQI